MKQEIETIRGKVRQILKEHESARNSDKNLIILYLVENKIGYHSTNGLFIPYKHFDDIPPFESITRARRKLQENGEFPATEEVQEHRNEEEVKMQHINDWFPNRINGIRKQTMLFEG